MSNMTFETLIYEEAEAGLGVLKLNRPKALNALNAQLLGELDSFLNDVEKMENLRCLIITGNSEKSFVAGADIKEMADLDEKAAQKFAENGQSIFSKIEAVGIPVIAAVNGFALGGGLELALSCDYIVCSNRARFGLPEVSLGLIPGFGGTQRLQKAVGLRMAREMIFTGGHYDALAAKEMRLVNRVVEPEMLMEAAKESACQILKRAPLAIAESKKAILQSDDLDLAQGLQVEAQLFSGLFDSEDTREGMQAFIEKRKPDFKGL